MAANEPRKGKIDYLDRDMIVITVQNDGTTSPEWEPGSTVLVHSASYSTAPAGLAQPTVIVLSDKKEPAKEKEKKRSQVFDRK